MKICPNCGSEVLENAQYCTRCGWHFEAVDDHKTADQEIQPASTTGENSELPATESISEPRTIAAERPQAAAGQHGPQTSTIHKRPLNRIQARWHQVVTKLQTFKK